MKMLSLIVLMALLSLNAQAIDFGKQGNSFSIKEEGFITMIKRKLKGVDLAEHEEKMRALVKKRVEEPEAIFGISRAEKTVSHSFDPSYMLDQDIVLPCGKLLYAAGEMVNPLDHMSWDGKLLFIDARDKEQVDWLLKSYFRDEQKNEEQEVSHNKIVLVAGKPFELEEDVQQPVYFDQTGELTKKFNIAHVPAIVEQDGKFLKVTEVDIAKVKLYEKQ